MSDAANPTPAMEPPVEDKPKPTLGQKLTQWFIAIALLVSGGLGLLKVYNQFTLPSCDEERTTTAIKDIFKSKNVELTGFTDAKSVTNTFSEKTCQAHVKTATEEANIDYRIYWEGWTAKVIITKVN
jgi:hypothetical protein